MPRCILPFPARRCADRMFFFRSVSAFSSAARSRCATISGTMCSASVRSLARLTADGIYPHSATSISRGRFSRLSGRSAPRRFSRKDGAGGVSCWESSALPVSGRQWRCGASARCSASARRSRCCRCSRKSSRTHCGDIRCCSPARRFPCSRIGRLYTASRRSSPRSGGVCRSRC